MRQTNTKTFDGVISKLSKRFESNPYSLSKNELEILKWFSKNQKPLEKLNKEEIFKMKTNIIDILRSKKFDNDK